MTSIVASITVKGLFKYLLTRAKLRFLPRTLLFVPKTIKINGRNIKINAFDLEQKYLAFDCIREPENYLVYKAIAKAKLVNTFIDIGANCGHVSLPITNDYKKLFLIEPNPNLASILKLLFSNKRHVHVIDYAVVGKKRKGFVTLNVPKSSSGLATLGNFLLKDEKDFDLFKVKATTLSKLFNKKIFTSAYIKIDVEGLEKYIIESSSSVFEEHRPIVGFESLSSTLADECMKQFKQYNFYCARFDFLENGGALSRSFFGIFYALLFGAKIEIIKSSKNRNFNLENFSQIYAVPIEKSKKFEFAIQKYFSGLKFIHLARIKAWKT